MKVVFELPDELVPRIVAATCAAYGYQAEVPDPDNPGRTIPNPVDPGAFTRQQAVNFYLQIVQGQEAAQASETARQAKIDEIKAIDLSAVQTWTE